MPIQSFEHISELGEGPHWDEISQTLLYVDITGGKCCRLDPKTGESETVHFDGNSVSVVVPSASDSRKLMVALTKQLVTLNWPSKHTEKLLDLNDGLTNNRFNDGKCDPRGRLWIGTMQREKTPDISPNFNFGLFSVDSKFKVTQHLHNIGISNGLAWTADHKTMFYIDSIPRKVYAFDYDVDNGTIDSQRVVVDFNTSKGYADFGFPDGMTMDTEGKLWVACFNGSSIIRMDPETGQLLETVKMPASKITSCCFGGPQYDELYVTSAFYGLSEDELKAQPQAGCVFKVSCLGAKGSPPYNFGV